MMLSRDVKNRDRFEDSRYEEEDDDISVLGGLLLYRSSTVIAIDLASSDTRDELRLIWCYLTLPSVGKACTLFSDGCISPPWLAKKITDADQGPRCDGEDLGLMDMGWGFRRVDEDCRFLGPNRHEGTFWA